MSEREKILGRVREALAIRAPMPGHAGHETAAAPGLDQSKEARRWLPAVGETFEERVALFSENSGKLKADFRLVDSQLELERSLAQLGASAGWKKIGAHRGELIEAACRALNIRICRTDRGYRVEELEDCDAGITECDALIAQTGTVLVTSRSAGGRALSVLPPHHVVLARRAQLVADLPEAFALLKTKYGADYPSFISLITGPSRTGDIERILVLGAHGPRQLTIFCL